MPEISVIIPCYNVEKYLAECLDSVLGQSFEDFEAICVNDGSTDKTGDILAQYANKDKRIKVITQENQGVVYSRNRAIEEAKGIYIFPLDGDDVIEPSCLEKLYKVIHEGIFDVVYSQVQMIDDIGNKGDIFERDLPDKRNMFISNKIVCSALYKKQDWLRYGGYDDAMSAGYEDWEFWLNFIEDNKEFYRIDEPLFCYRQHRISRNRSILSSTQKKLIKYIRTKHCFLQKYQVTSSVPFLKKVSLFFFRIFHSKRKYKKLRQKYIIDGVDYSFSRSPKLIMVLLVKNEADILEENLIYHKSMGVDGFIITDNSSNDGTLSIIDKYKEKGWILDVIHETAQDYAQVEWVNRMIVLARAKYHADWVISADADEFWSADSGNLKDYLNVNNNKIYVPIYAMLSEHDDWKLNTSKVVRSFPQSVYKKILKEQKLAKFNQFSLSIPKVIFRAHDYKMIKMGNHDCDMMYSCVRDVSSNIQIYHYNVRGYRHFVSKMLVGGAALDRNSKIGKGAGAHWRYFYYGVTSGTLDMEEEYSKYNGSLVGEEIEKYHIVQKDFAVKQFFENRNNHEKIIEKNI